MLKRAATVVKINDQAIWVRSARQTACESCTINPGCGVSLLDNYFYNNNVNNNAGQVSVQLGSYQAGDFGLGDRVIVGLQERALIKGSLLVYFLPLVFMVGFALFGQFLSTTIIASIDSAIDPTLFFDPTLFNAESLTVIFAFVGLASGFYFVKYLLKKICNDVDFKAVILEQSH